MVSIWWHELRASIQMRLYFPVVHMAICLVISLFLASILSGTGREFLIGDMEPCTLMNMIPFSVFLTILLLLCSAHWLCRVVTCEVRTLEMTCIYTLSPITHSTGQNVQLPM